MKDEKKRDPIVYRCPCCNRRLFDAFERIRHIRIKCGKCGKLIDLYGK